MRVDDKPGASPFAGTAPYYGFRAPYAPEAFGFLASALPLDSDARVLDLGCGPGTIAIPLSERVAQVVAVDADLGMLAEGRALAAARGRRNIRWIASRAEDLPTDLGRFRLATLGQSFHWMDRDFVLRRLADLIEDGGALALVNPGKRRPQESWEPTANAVVARFLGPSRRHASMNSEPTNEPALLRSESFHDYSAREFSQEIARDIASVFGFLYSTSYAARSLFGDRISAFETELKAALLALEPTGVFEGRVETEVVLAPKRRGQSAFR